MIQFESLEKLAPALVAAQAEFEAVAKTADNPFFKSKYADLPSVVKAAAPILAKHGLAVTQHIGHDDLGDLLTTALIHESGEWLADTARLHLVKSDPQSHGSAITYMRRYGYMAVLGLVADIDDDANAASQAAQTPQRPAQTQRTTERRPSPRPVTASAQVEQTIDEAF